ncbi:hypothetical protein AAES_88475 [Amazona aestiva]|uniref:Uncharacterized protein n=1 Tax=Amazona aestiva TaxID=12930 RepID=A0A0Q3USJ3_AMAAE|nr:hypothetical protein AAES_88475 [Amazona aestiva]
MSKSALWHMETAKGPGYRPPLASEVQLDDKWVRKISAKVVKVSESRSFGSGKVNATSPPGGQSYLGETETPRYLVNKTFSSLSYFVKLLPKIGCYD